MMAVMETNTERKIAFGKERLGFFTSEAWAAETSMRQPLNEPVQGGVLQLLWLPHPGAQRPPVVRRNDDQA